MSISLGPGIGVVTRSFNQLIWDTDTDFNKGTLDSEIEVNGTGDSALLQLKTADPYAWYHLNESSGTTVTDSSSNGRDGTLQGAPLPTWVTGKLNNAIQLDGINNRISLGDIANFERTQPFSIGMWVYPTNIASSPFLAARFIGNQGWSWYITTAGKLDFRLANVYYSNALEIRGSTTLVDSNWYYVVVTYDGSSTAAGTKMYINSVLETPTVLYDSLTGTTLTAATCYLGMTSNGTFFLAGKIDETVIYDTEMTQSDITNRYNSGIGTEILYYTSGNWVSNQYNSTYRDLDWGEVTWDTTTPTGTDLIIKARAANSITELDAASYTTITTSGNDSGVTGQYMQFKTEFSGTNILRSNLKQLTVNFDPPIREILTP